MDNVRYWYDGFIFGKCKDIYNPWSIINFLKTGKIASYWVNTSSNNLVGKLIQEGSVEIKKAIEDFLNGGTLKTRIDESLIFDQLPDNDTAIWSLLLKAKSAHWIKGKQEEISHTEKFPPILLMRAQTPPTKGRRCHWHPSTHPLIAAAPTPLCSFRSWLGRRCTHSRWHRAEQ